MTAPSDAQQTLDGVLERYTFRNEDNAFSVARFVDEASKEIVVVVGELVGVHEGSPLRLRGEWVVDKKWGKQFKIASYQVKSPNTLVGIEKFLSSGIIAGIGEEFARRLVTYFGMDTLEVIEKSPERLTEVSGIGAGRAAKIAEAFAAAKHVQDVMVFLRGHGVSASFAARIVKRYGNNAVNVVRDNPYRLATEVWGIGFRSADAIAEKLGIAKDAPARIEAGLLFALDHAAEDGHVWVTDSQLFELAEELLRTKDAKYQQALDALAASRLVVVEELLGRGRCVALPRLQSAEAESARSLTELLATPSRVASLDIDAAIVDFELAHTLSLAPEQRTAIASALVEKCSIITGGPGVGKTTIVRGICHLAKMLRRQIALCAPTGRAAKRMAEATGQFAQTIHRLLEYQPNEHGFARNRENPIEADLVIVDETSMVDIVLFSSLIEAIPRSAQLVLVGDIDQLPSVGPGAVLTDLIDSKAIAVNRLTQIFRQALASKIVTSAHKINAGQLPEIDTRNDSDDFYFVEREDPIKARETIVELVSQRIPNRFGLDPLTQVQVLAPMHRGELGTEALNLALQQALVKDTSTGAASIRRGDRKFCVGDKVMQLKNDYERNVYNGDIGIVLQADSSHHTVTVDYGDAKENRVVMYERADLDQLTHAFAVSIHKSQGSEYAAVVIPVATQHFMMLQRSLLYTAVTRGKRLVVLVGTRKALSMAVRNADAKKRMTWLAERVRTAESVYETS